MPGVNRTRSKQAKFLRTVRKIHRWTGISLFIFFVFISVTGFLLGWKKNSNGYLLPTSTKGISTEISTWLPIETLQENALVALNSFNQNLDTEIDRIDIRPNKGMVKFTFKNHYQEIQLDCTTGKLLQIGTRRSDFIEQIHDGSILDQWLGIGFFKLVYTSITGIALLTFTVTGFWLWYGPRRMRQY